MVLPKWGGRRKGMYNTPGFADNLDAGTLARWTHQDIGQMDMYVRRMDDLKRAPDDNPTAGIISLC
jgi:hypothetical protein